MKGWKNMIINHSFWTMKIHIKFNGNCLKLSYTSRHTGQPCLPSLSCPACRTNIITKALAKILQTHYTLESHLFVSYKSPRISPMTSSTTAVALKGATVQTRHRERSNQMCWWCLSVFFTFDGPMHNVQ